MTAMPASPELPDRPGSALPPDALPDVRPEDVLPCGVPLAVLVDQADDGRLEPVDAHQAACPYCRAGLRAAAAADHALGLLRATTGPTPPGLVARVMNRVRQTRHEQPAIELSGSPGSGSSVGGPGGSRPSSAGRVQVAGGVRVGRQVVADLARQAAAGLRGVTVARAAAEPRPGRPGAVDVHLGLLVDGRTPLPELARQVRRQVRRVLQRSLGPGEVTIELTALDLVDPD